MHLLRKNQGDNLVKQRKLEKRLAYANKSKERRKGGQSITCKGAREDQGF